jgi:PEP-CTERM motif
MRNSIWVFVAALILAVCAPYAHADSLTDGTYNFTVTAGSPTPTGSFVWDSTTNTWSSWTVDWDGAVYNFGSSSGGAFTLSTLPTSGTWCGAAPSNFSFSCEGQAFFSLGAVDTILPDAGTFTDSLAGANGTYTVTETPVATTPEPSSLGLLLAGIGLLLLTRKLTRQRLPQAS